MFEKDGSDSQSSAKSKSVSSCMVLLLLFAYYSRSQEAVFDISEESAKSTRLVRIEFGCESFASSGHGHSGCHAIGEQQAKGGEL